MDAETTFRRVRGAMRNAVVWGVGWGCLTLPVFAALKITGVLPASAQWIDAVAIAVKLGCMGGIVGGAFSAFVAVVYSGRRLSQLSAVRFGLTGGLVAGVFVPAFLQTMSLVTGGGPVPIAHVLDDALLSALFGAVVAGGSLKLAQNADPQLPRPGRQDRPGLSGGTDPLSSAAPQDAGRQAAPAWRSAR